MKPETQDLLERFRQLDWFHAVKLPMNDDVLPVKTWLEASNLALNGAWEVTGYMNGVQMEKVLKEEVPEERWASAVDELRPLARQIVTERLAPARERKQWSRMLDMIADYHISYALLEQEFLDILGGPGFFGIVAHWYLEGHLPCGLSEKSELFVY